MEPLNCFDVMVDIETTGTRPDENAILQIAAVKFDPWEKKVDPNFFTMNLFIPPKRFWDEGTRHWWMQQDPAVYEAVTSNPQDPAYTMGAFADWAGYQHDAPLRFWAKPTSFDFMFVASYFNQFSVHNPFHYRESIDLNSFIRGRRNNGRASEKVYDLQFEGDAHNGIFDCLHQIKVAFAAAEDK